MQLREQVVATLGYVVGDRALATLLLQAAQTPEAEAAERLNQFYDEVRRPVSYTHLTLPTNREG